MYYTLLEKALKGYTVSSLQIVNKFNLFSSIQSTDVKKRRALIHDIAIGYDRSLDYLIRFDKDDDVVLFVKLCDHAIAQYEIMKGTN